MSNILIAAKKRVFSLLANPVSTLGELVDTGNGIDPILWDDGTTMLWDDNSIIYWDFIADPILIEGRRRNFSLVARKAENV